MFIQRKYKIDQPVNVPARTQGDGMTAATTPMPLHYNFSQIPVNNSQERAADAAAEKIAHGAAVNKATDNLETQIPMGIDTGPQLSNRINEAAPQGKPMDTQTRASMTKGFGMNFNEVRIHADKEAAGLSNALQAEAFTSGKDIFFSDGAYRPDTQDGKKLLAHELTHVAQQQQQTTVQRKATPSAENLADVAETDRKEIRREKTPVKSTELDATKLTSYFATDPKLAGGATESVAAPGDNIQFSANIKSIALKKGFDIQRGLKSVAGYLNSNFTPSVLPLNSSTEISLDLTPFGGPLSIFRFSYYDKKEGKTSSEELLIELLSATAAAPKNTMPVSGKPFSIGSHSFNLDSGWAQDEYDQLILAMNQVPEPALKLVENITFKRGPDIAGDTEAGHYDQDKNFIIIRNKAFGDDLLRYGSYKFAVQAIVHEIGHAIDFVNVNKAWKEYEKDTDDKKLKKSTTQSGEQWRMGGDGKYELTDTGLETDFRKAAKKDTVTKGPGSITEYGSTNALDNFAEAFSMFVTDPDFFKQLRPATYEFFKKNFKP